MLDRDDLDQDDYNDYDLIEDDEYEDDIKNNGIELVFDNMTDEQLEADEQLTPEQHKKKYLKYYQKAKKLGLKRYYVRMNKEDDEFIE